MIELIWMALFCIVIFFFQDIVAFFVRRLSPSSKRLIWYAAVTMFACGVSGIIGCVSPEDYKLAICLASFGMICLMTIFILSLLFVATIPEGMESEDERD